MTYYELVQAIHASPTKAYISIAGGGAGIFNMLLSQGGGSSTLIGAEIPYSLAAMEDLVGKGLKPVSKETAQAMARKSYEKAVRFSGDALAVGIGLTASLAKVPTEREGRIHEAWVCLDSAFERKTGHIKFNQKAFRDTTKTMRSAEEEVCWKTILWLLAKMSGVHTDILETESIGVQSIISIHTDTLFSGATWGGNITPWEGPAPKLLFPGSFNPPHSGHQEMANLASEVTGIDDCYAEISIVNADKGTMSSADLNERLLGMSKKGLSHRTVVTKARTFVEKAKLFPGATFVIGYDTAIRIIDPKYAGPVDDVLKCFEENGTKFVMFPRIVDGVMQSNLTIFPERFLKLVTVYTKDRKFAHLASKDLRAK